MSTLPHESDCVDENDVDAGIGMDSTGESSMSAVTIGGTKVMTLKRRLLWRSRFASMKAKRID